MSGGLKFRHGLLLGLMFGASAQLVGMRFVPSVIMLFTDLGVGLALLSHVLLAFAQSLHWALGVGLAAVLIRRAKAPVELALGGGVLLALSIPSVFVWSPAGLLSPWPVLLQTAEYFGERGVSVLMAVIAVLVVRAALSRDWRPAVGAAVMLALLWGHGTWRMASIDASYAAAPRARIALVHINVDPKERWQRKAWPSIVSRLRQQTGIAETAGVDLSIWPEAAYPYPLPHDSLAQPRGGRRILGGTVKGPVLFGFIALDAPVKLESGKVERNKFNAATVVSDGGKMQPSYDKMELLWFGEMVPLGQYFPALRRLFHRSGSLIPGRELRKLESGPMQMGIFNCYEDTLPAFGRQVMARHQPNLLVNVTNDAWFVGTEEAELHVRLSVMRSIELRRDLVRSVNLGVPAHIDAAGRVIARDQSTEPGFLLVSPALRNDPLTVYARFGDLPMIFLLVIGIGVTRLLHQRSELLGVNA